MNLSWRFRHLSLAAAVAALLVTTASAGRDGFAATQDSIHVGRAKVVVRDVRGQIREQAAEKVTINQRLFFEQRIITTGNSRSVVEFRDGSLLQVGPDAVLVLNKFVFNPFESRSEKVVTAVKGAFRFVSGIKTKESSIEIRTPAATIGIRGSQGEFLVHPSVPLFFALGDGVATVRNARGTVSMRPGQAIAVRDRNARMPEPRQIPPAVAAQALRHIARRVGPPPSRRALTPLNAAQARVEASANSVAASEQASQQTGAAPPPPPPAPAAEPPPQDVGLLTKAAEVGLLDKAPDAPLTQAQSTFVREANAAIPDAVDRIRTSVQEARRQTGLNGDRSTRNIVKTATEFSGGADNVKKLVEAAAAADPRRAVIVATSAADGAPGQTVSIAEAASRAASPAAAQIASRLAQKAPEQAAEIAVAVSAANRDQAAAVAASVARVLAPDQRPQILAAVQNAVPEQSSNIAASLADRPASPAPQNQNPDAEQKPPAGEAAAGPVSEVTADLIGRLIAGEPQALELVRTILVGDGSDGTEGVVKRAKELIANLGAEREKFDTKTLLQALDGLASEAINLVSGSQVVRIGIDKDYVPENAVVALDFGPPDGNVSPGFERVQPGDPRIAGVDVDSLRRPADSELLNDGVTGVQRIEVDLPDGEYRVILMTQDLGDRSLTANPFGTEIALNGVSQSIFKPAPDKWVPGALLSNGGPDSLLSRANASSEAVPIGQLRPADQGLYQRQQGGAVILTAVVRGGKLVIEMDGFTNAQSYLTGLVVEPVAERSDLTLSEEAAETLRPPELRLALEEEIVAAAAELLSGIDPAAGEPELVELPEPILDPEELASTSQ